jgi:hypothetical protein
LLLDKTLEVWLVEKILLSSVGVLVALLSLSFFLNSGIVFTHWVLVSQLVQVADCAHQPIKVPFILVHALVLGSRWSIGLWLWWVLWYLEPTLVWILANRYYTFKVSILDLAHEPVEVFSRIEVN